MEEMLMQSSQVELGIWEVFVQSRISISMIFLGNVISVLIAIWLSRVLIEKGANLFLKVIFTAFAFAVFFNAFNNGLWVNFFLDGTDLKIESGSGKYNLTTLPSEDFPNFEVEDSSSEINISSNSLKTLISTTAFAMGNDSWRDYLSGLNLIIDDKIITAVATDGSRLAVANSSLNEAVPNNISGIVPKKSINEIGKLVAESTENILIKLGSTSISVSAGGTNFVSKLIEGKFPDHEQVIPFGESSMMKIDRKEFSESLSRVSVLSGGDHKGVRFITEENIINISANNPDKERGEESLACSYKGENIDIAFNINYFQEILSSINSQEVEINFFGSERSCLVIEPNNESLKYVVMPLLV